MRKECPECKGAGEVEVYDTTRGPEGERHLATCQGCLGEGQVLCLEKPAQVGNTIFGIGVSERLVIERAQREHGFRQRTTFEVVRCLSADNTLKRMWLESALADLVALKGIKDALDEHREGRRKLDDFDKMEAEYKERKPLAWRRAMELLAPRYLKDEEIPF